MKSVLFSLLMVLIISMACAAPGEIIPGDCLNERGYEIDCDSDKSVYSVTDSSELMEYDSYEDFTYSKSIHENKCRLDADSVFYPDENRWDSGDRGFYCVRSLSLGESDLTQRYFHEKVLEGDCLNQSGNGVGCESDSAEFRVTYSHSITGVDNYPEDEFSSYDSKCPTNTEKIFFPTMNSWDVGDRNFMCVVLR